MTLYLMMVLAGFAVFMALLAYASITEWTTASKPTPARASESHETSLRNAA